MDGLHRKNDIPQSTPRGFHLGGGRPSNRHRVHRRRQRQPGHQGIEVQRDPVDEQGKLLGGYRQEDQYPPESRARSLQSHGTFSPRPSFTNPPPPPPHPPP